MKITKPVIFIFSPYTFSTKGIGHEGIHLPRVPIDPHLNGYVLFLLRGSNPPQMFPMEFDRKIVKR